MHRGPEERPTGVALQRPSINVQPQRQGRADRRELCAVHRVQLLELVALLNLFIPQGLLKFFHTFSGVASLPMRTPRRPVRW